MRRIRRRYSQRLESASADDVRRFVRGLLRGGGWAERIVAWETIAFHPESASLVNDDFVEELSDGLEDWGSVDAFGVTLLGQAWRDGRVTDSKIGSWVRSSNRWRRRLALVATVPLNSRARGGRGDSRRTLRVCRALIDDRDDMVVKAMSWALRELAKRDPATVARFVRDEEDRLASRVRREVRNKLQTGLKIPRRTAAKKATGRSGDS